MARQTTGRLLIIFILVVIFGWCGFAIWMQSLLRPGPLESETTVILPRGAGTHQIADVLTAAHVINRPLEFRLASRARFADRYFKAGEYTFPAHVSMQAVIQKLSGGDVVQRFVTIPEGLTYAEIRQRLLDTEGLYGPPLFFQEGALLPETYDFKYGDKRADLMKRMDKAMTDKVAAIWATRDPDLPLNTPTELLILASIIEKETALPAERPLVASVFVNRLRQGIRLQSDPTVIYGASNYHGDLTKAHLQEDQPYNTYLHKGLPPTPICNPGADALEAAAHPAHTNFLYFVANGSGGHLFTDDYKVQMENVQKMLLNQRAAAAAEPESTKP